MKKKLTIWLAAAALLAGACASEPTVSEPTASEPAASTAAEGPAADSGTDGPADVVSPSAAPSGPVGLFASQLVEYGSCPAFLDRLKAEALERVGPYGFGDGSHFFIWNRADAAVEEADMASASAEAFTEEASALAPATTALAAAPAAEEAAADSGGGGSAGRDFSTTNVQEAGVDEPDLVKTDGRRILALAQGVLHYIDASSGAPELVSSLDLRSEGDDLEAWNHQMFLSGEAALLMASSYTDEGEVTLVHQIDLSDPAAMRKVRTLSAEGRFISARLVGGRANLVLASDPGVRFEFLYPSSDSESAKNRAEMVNRLVIQESTLEDWMPFYTLSGGASPSSEGMLVDCSKAYAPQEFSGFSFLTVLAVDLEEGIEPGAVATVVSGGDTVYASQDNLYVATQRWIDWGVIEDDEQVREEADAAVTHIHRFAVGGPGGPEYTASGAVSGYLLNQFAMSEHDGYLRVASTNAPPWGWWGEDTESRVDVLEQNGRELRTAGSVGGLGPGERIFAVRFIGDTGYVVTFRQTDPLYTIDLSDPADPKVMGELKILGYSAYLHPIGDGLLIGVGQDADVRGVTRGTQVSIFDVSDLSDPVRLHQYTLAESSSSEVEFDHRAFLYWPATETLVLPVGWGADGRGGWEWFSGAKVLKAGEGGIEDLGFIEHRPSWAERGRGGLEGEGYYGDETVPIRRSLVIGPNLFTLSDGGLKASDLASLSERAWIEFPFEGYGAVPEPFPID